MENDRDNDRLFTTIYGGTIQERDGKLVFTSKPRPCKDKVLNVGDCPPEEWQLFPMNMATINRITREAPKFPPLTDKDIIYMDDE